jgi:formamidopyrimidine-DNA glycosylase
MNQILIAGAGAVLVASSAFAAGVRWQRGAEALAERAAAQAAEVATQAAVEQISRIEVKNVTIRQTAETITREVPVFSECRAGERMFGLINEALGATAPYPDGLPATGAAD